MQAYIDASVILRMILGQPDRLAEWAGVTAGISSRLVEVECLRTLDRLRINGLVSAEQTALQREAVFIVLEGLELVELTGALLHRASQPMPAPLGTLDAIHLATAEMWREVNGALVMATHDRALALAARASGFRAIGT